MTKMCLWSMGQDDEFYDERLNELKYGGGIWNLLSAVLQLSEEQKRKIVGSRGGLKRQQENIATVLSIVNRVQEKVEKNMESMQKQMQGILAALSPFQQAQFLLWMENDEGFVASLRRVLQMRPDRSGDNAVCSESSSASSV